jgi:tetratricopeptide (TPR) repeat protein
MPTNNPSKNCGNIMGCLLVSRNDLFGARMLPFMNALRIGHDYDLPVKIFWPVAGGENTNIGEYTQVFGESFLNKHFIQADEFQELTKQAIGLPQMRLTSVTEIVQMIRSGSVMALNGGNVAMALGGEDEQKVNESYRATLDRISFAPLISENIKKIKLATQGKSFLAYHVRHGDVTNSYRAKNKPWPNKFIPSEFFVQHFEKHSEGNDANALVFGDFSPSLDWICAQCSGLQQIGNVIDFSNLGSLQRDFLELYAMSRAEQIIGPKNSGFSQLAASLGGIELKDIMKSLSSKDYRIAFSKLFKRITNAPETFSSKGEIGQCLAHLGPQMMRIGQTTKLVKVLKDEMQRGNNISFLFPLLARAQFTVKNYAEVLDTRKQSLTEPLFDPISVAELDAFAAQSAFHLGDTTEATRLLAIAVFHTPYAKEVRRAFALLDQANFLNDTDFYPTDRILMKLLQNDPDKFNPAHFAWEWRNSLISNFQRPLTFGGAANLYIKKMDTAIKGKKLDNREQARFNSFKSLVLMGLGLVDDALTLSIQAMDLAAKDPFVLKRHVQNLLLNRDFDLALRYARDLVKDHPDIPMYRMLLADCYFGKRKRVKAIDLYNGVNENDLRFLGGTLRHGGALNALDRSNEALNLLTPILPEVRWTDQYLDILTTTKLNQGTQQELLPFLEKLSDESYTVRKVSHMLARIKLANRDFEGAEKDAKRAIAYAPNIFRFHEHLARIYLAQDRQSDAMDIIQNLPTPMQKRFQ